MQSVEADGTTIDEAIENALDMLQVERDRVEIEIITDATRGLFGLGGKKARVRATLRAPLWGSDRHAELPDDIGNRQLPQAPSPADRSSNRRRAGRPASPGRDGDDERSTDEAGEDVPTSAPRIPVQISKEGAERGAEFLRKTLELMGMEASVEIETSPPPYDEVVLQVNGDSSGVVIGRHGQTVDAIEYIVNRLVAREFPNQGHVVVDAAGYRTRRRQSLTDMARRLADKARRERRTVTLNPLSPRDRRVVHIALKNERGITTRSHGVGLHRKLLIIPGSQNRRQTNAQMGDR
jgi:spoIIIJ-associated protein